MDTASFVLSKLAWAMLRPANLSLLLFALACLLLWTRWTRAARVVLLLLALGLGLVAVLPVGPWLLAPLEDRFPVPAEPLEPPAGIVVLAGAELPHVTERRRQSSLGAAADRLVHFVRLARELPEARLAFAGGTGQLRPGRSTSAGVAKRVFRELGFDDAGVVYEDRSRNTYESARNLAALIAPKPGETWLLVTSARHMPRAVGMFRRQGWTVRAYPVDYITAGPANWRLDFNLGQGLWISGAALKEWIGLAYAYLTGQTTELFPGPAAPAPRR